MAAATFVNAVGRGAYLTAGVLYFTQVLRLPAHQVGIALSIAGLLSLAAGPPSGHLADRIGGRGLYILTLVAGGLATAAFALSTGFWGFLAAAAICALLPPTPPAPVRGGPRRIALRDLPYVALTVLDGLMSVQFKVLTIAIPLWIVASTAAPAWLISVTLLVNTAIIGLFQARVARGVDTPAAAGRAMRRAGAAFLLSCAAIALAASVPAWAAAALLLGAAVVHTAGELWHAAGRGRPARPSRGPPGRPPYRSHVTAPASLTGLNHRRERTCLTRYDDRCSCTPRSGARPAWCSSAC
ncbi:MFS transporter [Nonomuraea typhae]|uniref:MFS transporter n=1 Tax=Nonomuraea typhae TaxID=2603600 RepID=A0ABW7Z762_9ACTN